MTSDDDPPSSWEATFRRSYPSLYRALVAVLLDGELARDALQEAFVEGLRRPPPSDHALAGWLFRVALRRARQGSASPRGARKRTRLHPTHRHISYAVFRVKKTMQSEYCDS